MLYEADELSEIFKGMVPLYLLLLLPLIFIISPVAASHEYQVHRMHQFDLHGISRGCRVSSVNLEARSVFSWGTQRHCVISRLSNLTSLGLYKIKEGAGGLVIVLPTTLVSLTDQEKEVLSEFEAQFLADEINIPVYFTFLKPDLEEILIDLESNKATETRKTSAWEAILQSLSANGYQIVISANKPTPRPDAQVISIQGKLTGLGVEEKLPSIAIVSHYDSFGVAPGLSFGAESNGSGVIILLELIRIFSQLYSDSKSHARVNLLFLLSGGGKINYQGSKKWLEDQLDGIDVSLLHDAQYVICLDSASTRNLYFHVSKPPKEGLPLAQFYNELSAFKQSSLEIIHKKINLADEMLAWEHERFSIRRLPASTISSFKSHKDPRRGTVFDIPENIDIPTLVSNIESIASVLAKQIFNITGEQYTEPWDLGADEDIIRMWLEFLTSHSRSASLLYEKNNPLIKSLHDYMKRFLDDVKTSSLVADKRDPEFVFYDVTKSIVNIYSVKPAVFDLFLTMLISLYLAVIYIILQQFQILYGVFVPISKTVKQQ